MNLSRLIFFLIVALSSVGFATAEGPFLPAQKNEESKTKSGLSRILTTVGEKFKPGKPPSSGKRGLRRILSTTLGEATKAKEAGKPPSSGKRGLRRILTTLGEATKAGKAPSSDEGLHRKREHQCTMALIEDEYLYQSGCDGNSWEVKITCKKKGRREERNSGLICNYYEKTVDEDSDKCPYSGDFVSKDVLNTDGEGNCVLGPIPLYPVATAGNEGCTQNHPKLDVKIIPVGIGELQIYFSNDGGVTYYNQGDPRVALSLQIHGGGDDANGMNSGGGSSKGGKAKNHRRLEVTKAQLQRKLQCTCNDDENCKQGDTCKTFFGSHWTCGSENLYCHDGQCHTVTKGEGAPCGGLTICDPKNEKLGCLNGQCHFEWACNIGENGSNCSQGSKCKPVATDPNDPWDKERSDGFNHKICGSDDLWCHCSDGNKDDTCQCYTIAYNEKDQCGGLTICYMGWEVGCRNLFCCEGECLMPILQYANSCDRACPLGSNYGK